MTNPWIEAGEQRGLKRGLKRGRQQGEAGLVLKQLRRRLGAISAAQERAIRNLSLRRVERLGEALLGFQSRADLVRWLRHNAS